MLSVRSVQAFEDFNPILEREFVAALEIDIVDVVFAGIDTNLVPDLLL